MKNLLLTLSLSLAALPVCADTLAPTKGTDLPPARTTEPAPAAAPAAAPAPAPAPAPKPAPAAGDSGRILSQVLGNEEVQVFLRLDVMLFLPAKKLP